jgi:hypothetical protein
MLVRTGRYRIPEAAQVDAAIGRAGYRRLHAGPSVRRGVVRGSGCQVLRWCHGAGEQHQGGQVEDTDTDDWLQLNMTGL